MSNMKALTANWALPDRTSERVQFTLRLNYNEYARLHALKEVYPHRAINDFLNDIIHTALDEIVDSLPTYEVTEEEALRLSEKYGAPPDEFEAPPYGPRVVFNTAYRRMLEEKSSDKSEEVSA